MVKAFLLEFEAPYHVGWRRPRALIDHTTVLRALASTAYMVGEEGVGDGVRDGLVASTSILPTARAGGEVIPLAPFPALPLKAGKLRKERYFIPLKDLREVVRGVSECVKGGGVPYVDYADVEGREFLLLCGDEVKAHLHEVAGAGEGVNVVSVKEGVTLNSTTGISEVKQFKNRVDRVSGAADVYDLRGYVAKGVMWVGVEVDGIPVSKVRELMKVLGMLGIGAYRSRGWGRFRVLGELELSDVDARFLKGEVNYLLGTYPFSSDEVDVRRSYVNLARVEGRAGPTHLEYDLPVINVADAGSLLYVVREGLRHRTVRIKAHDALREEPFITFNPLVITPAGR